MKIDFSHKYTETQRRISPFTEQENQENTRKIKFLEKKKVKNNKEEYI